MGAGQSTDASGGIFDLNLTDTNHETTPQSDGPEHPTLSLSERRIQGIPNDSSSNFSRLPPEIRDDIFKSLVGLEDDNQREVRIITRKKNGYSYERDGPWPGADFNIRLATPGAFPQVLSSLLNVNNQFQREVLKQLLMDRILCFDSSESLFGVLMRGGPNLMAAIRHVKVRGWGCYNKEALEGLALCNDLQSLTIVGARMSYLNTDRKKTVTAVRPDAALRSIAGLTRFAVEINPDVLQTDDRIIPPTPEETWGPAAYRPFLRGTYPEFRELEAHLMRNRDHASPETIDAWLKQKVLPTKQGVQRTYMISVVAERPQPVTLGEHFAAESADPDDVIEDPGPVASGLAPGWVYRRSFV